jgi:hypothetical protein
MSDVTVSPDDSPDQGEQNKPRDADDGASTLQTTLSIATHAVEGKVANTLGAAEGEPL